MAILNFKYQVIWGLESKTLRDLGSPIEDLIIFALHGPPIINKGIWSGFQHFSFPDLASDDCILTVTIDKIVFRSSCGFIPAFSLNDRAPKGLGTTKWTNYIGQKKRNIDGGLNSPYMTSISTRCCIYRVKVIKNAKPLAYLCWATQRLPAFCTYHN